LPIVGLSAGNLLSEIRLALRGWSAFCRHLKTRWRSAH
jgi:hypothetical protein